MTHHTSIKSVGRWCADCLRDMLLACLWLALAAGIALQLFIWSSREIPMPDWLLRRFEARMEDFGLKASIGSATLNSAGRVVIQDLCIMQGSRDTTLLTAETVRFSLDLWALANGVFDSKSVQAGGLTLWLPAMVSPSGQPEPIASDISLSATAANNRLSIHRMDGRLASLTFSLTGAVDLPRQALPPEARDHRAASARIVKQYLRIGRKAAELETRLTAFVHPRLAVGLVPAGPGLANASLTFSAEKADINLAGQLPQLGRVQVPMLRVSTRFALVAERGQRTRISIRCDEVQSSAGHGLLRPRAIIDAEVGPSFESFDPTQLRLACDTITTTAPFAIDNLAARLTPVQGSRIHAEVTARAIGTDWTATAEGNPRSGGGTLSVDGAITPWLVRYVARRTGLPPSELVELQAPAPVSARAVFAGGWALQSLHGRISTGPLVAHRVPFDSITGTFDLRDGRLLVDDMTGRQGDNLARGSYWMDTTTHGYRFLLDGRLRPMGIAGFFREWWPRFWNNFDFAAAPTEASVDVAGRWGQPGLTTVFVRADVPRPVVRGVPFDRVRTSLFIRPDFYDGLELVLNRGEGSARGTFTRSVDLYRQEDALRSMTFEITSNLDLSESARLFGAEGIETVAPFKFATPPTLHARGRLNGGACPAGPRREVSLDLKSNGAFTFFDFPLRDLEFKGTVIDSNIDLTSLSVSFARGQARGNASLSGLDKNRRLRFDVDIRNASLGGAIGTLEDYFSRGKPAAPQRQSSFQQRLADGQLNLRLAAEGSYRDPLSFRGQGSLELSGAQLAQINLLGALSEILSSSSLFSFTSLQLNAARSSITLDRTRLSFPDLRITGQSSAIEAKGSVFLDRKIMDFNAKVYPFGHGKTLLADAVGLVLLPLSNVLELKLSGTIDKPEWRFAYGPTSFLHTLSGTKPGDAPAPAAPAGERKLPAPYLRR